MSKQQHSYEELLTAILQALQDINMENAVKGEPCHSLAGQLQTRTVDKLRELAGPYHVPRYSRMNKAALSQAMAERMTDPELLRMLLSVTERHQWELFKAAAAVDRYQDKRMAPDEYYGPQNICLLQLYAHEGEVSVVVADELKQAFALLKKEGFVEEQDHKVMLVAYAEAVVSLYGVISMDDFAALFNKQNKHKTDTDEMFDVLIKHVNEESVFCFWEDYLVNSGLEGDDFQSVKQYIRHGRGKPRYIPPQEELLSGSFQEPPQLGALRDYLIEFVYDDEDTVEEFADDVYSACVTQIPGESLTDDFWDIIKEHGAIGRKHFNDVLRLMNDVNNNARCWVNNGYTPSELAMYGLPATPPMHKKTGPNEPCPCGSRKKYKKCCMLK